MTSGNTTGFDIAALQSWIGREEQAAELLTPALLSRYHATFDLAGTPGDGDVYGAQQHAPLLGIVP